MATETCISERQNSTNSISVMDNIYGIIDSKIQYLDHQTKGIVRPLIKETICEENVQGEAKSCLLYTSPSPRDATLSRMPSSA